jgi:hypothetical protein
MVAFPVDNIGFEQLLEVPMQRVRSASFSTHFLQQLAETLKPLAIELDLDAERSANSEDFRPNVLFHGLPESYGPP